MVFVKVSDGYETRKLQISPEATYDQLREQVQKLFPSLAEGVDFSLQYQDQDGDIISLSTDEELRTALAHLPQDTIWRLQAVPQRRRAPGLPHPSSWHPFGPRRVVPRHPGFPHFSPPHHRHFLDPFHAWSEPAPALVDVFFSPRTDWGSMWKEMDQEMEQMRKMHDDHMHQFEEQRQKVEEQMQKTLQRQQSLPAAQGASAEGQVAETGKPTWHMQQFGSWEPQTFESPYGRRTVVGPVSYHMYWGYSDPHQPEEGQEPEEKGMDISDAADPKKKRNRDAKLTAGLDLC